MARRNDTVWCAVFDDLQLHGLCEGIIKLNGAPFYVHQMRANPPQVWVARILRRKAEPILQADSAEAAKFAVERMCHTKVTEWQEGYWDDDTWQPKTSRPAPVVSIAPPPETTPLPEVLKRERQRKGEKV